MNDISELERISREMFGMSFTSLSPFGQHSVRLHVQASHPIENFEKDKLIQRQAAEIIQLKTDLKEAWEENEDLQLEILNKEEDEYTVDRSPRTRERQTGLANPGESTPLDVLRRGDESSVPGSVRPGSSD